MPNFTKGIYDVIDDRPTLLVKNIALKNSKWQLSNTANICNHQTDGWTWIVEKFSYKNKISNKILIRMYFKLDRWINDIVQYTLFKIEVCGSSLLQVWLQLASLVQPEIRMIIKKYNTRFLVRVFLRVDGKNR